MNQMSTTTKRLSPNSSKLASFRTKASSGSKTMSWIIPLILVIGIVCIFIVWHRYSCQRKQDNVVVSGLSGGRSRDSAPNNPTNNRVGSGSGNNNNKNNHPALANYPAGQAHDIAPNEMVNLSNAVPIFVAFMSKNCGHCTNLKPIYHEASNRSSVPFFIVLADRPGADALFRQLNIKGYPTLAKVHKGQITQEFQQERKAHNIVAFAERD